MADFKNDLITAIKEQFEGERTIDNMVTFLLEKGLVDEATAKKAVVKYNYKRLRRWHNAGYSKEQLSDMYSISVSTVENYLYRTSIAI